ncbi:nicotinate (nicotinamide) nucleotide adenylyltransferase [Ideonella livida]|uniref:Probable nicotinate-nucleotide adenylyltransferase n=1 Tax=Ideonella livida TaxID=2707176 RepID=A0A7C9PEY1_9BURK|nr:nicotinate (nicotinamide) nucleotide adenylyltransferase [Ideonella livida]NDY90216.1 nicotinate (nicotinamide) nucleotide adenylyltransferase [Ideonella livida]
MRLGLFGGSFNPPHQAHLALARLARDHLGLDRLLWLPAGAPWQKPAGQLAPGEHRAAMVQALIRDEPGFELDTRELRRQGPSYTLDTVLTLAAERPGAELWLIIGQDQLARLHTWHRAAELVDRVHLAVAAREGQSPQADPLLPIPRFPVVALPLPRTDLSATQIREELAEGRSVIDLVGPAVAHYLDQHGLYRRRA